MFIFASRNRGIMNKRIRKSLKIAVGIVAGILLLLTATMLILNSSFFQNKLLKEAKELLTKELKTRIEIEKLNVNLFNLTVNLDGMMIEDQQQREMLSIKQLAAHLDIPSLFRHEIMLESAAIDGVNAMITKATETEPANYQFLIDAINTNSKKKKKKAPEEEGKHKLTFNIGDIRLKNAIIHYDTYAVNIGETRITRDAADYQKFKLINVSAKWKQNTKKGPVDNSASVSYLLIEQREKHAIVNIEQFRFQTDNHKPRKNASKPKRGFFDTGHLDITANMGWMVEVFQKDSLKAKLLNCNATDSVTGINLTDLRMNLEANKHTINASNITLRQTNTVLNIPKAIFELPDKKTGKSLSYHADQISGRALLKDISRTFAPVLKNFSIPLKLSLKMSGTDNSLKFQNVRVSTEDNKLQIAADGGITDLKDKDKLTVRFHVNKMTAKGDVKQRIINQFAVKKFMMKQLDALGTIQYTGDFSVVRKKEAFKGLLTTDAGPIDFQFELDGIAKVVSGKVNTNDFELGKVMDMKSLGGVECQADFLIDISKERTARMRKQRGGKLPIGNISASVKDCSYKFVHVRDIYVDIKSDGAIATGNISQRGNFRDLYCSFSFTNTDNINDMKIFNTGIKFHKMSEEKKLEKQKRKEEKKLLKEEKKRQKEELKRQKKAQEQEEEKKTGKKKKRFLFF